MKKVILFSLVIFSCLGVIAQKNKAPEAEIIKDAIKIHKELNMDDAEASFKVIPVDSQGLIVAYMPESKAKNGLKDFIFKKLDISFQEDYLTKTMRSWIINMKERVCTFCLPIIKTHMAIPF